MDIRAKVTILCDGVRGNLTKALVRRLGARRGPRCRSSTRSASRSCGRSRRTASQPGTVIHTMGYPLRMEEFGGAFIYAHARRPACRSGSSAGSTTAIRCSIRTSRSSTSSGIRSFAALLAGGQMVRYGAKALPEGGWHTIPRVYADGVLIAGDAGGFMNSMRLKGIHLAMRTGHAGGRDGVRGGARRRHVRGAAAGVRGRASTPATCASELYPVRNVHQASATGCSPALVYSGLSLVTRRLVDHAIRCRRTPATSGCRSSRTTTATRRPDRRRRRSNPAKIDRQLTFDRLTNVHYSGTRHAEDQPSHLIVHDTDICRDALPRGVRQSVHALLSGERLRDGRRRRRAARSCRSTPRTACTARRATSWIPYQIIDWVPPEGGGGPQYEGM